MSKIPKRIAIHLQQHSLTTKCRHNIHVLVDNDYDDRNFRSVLSAIRLSRIMTEPTKWHVRPAKTQISLGIRPV